MRQVKDDKVLKAFGKHLKSVRLSKGLTQEKVANGADVAISTITRIEAGKLNVSITLIARLAKGLSVDKSELMKF